MTWTDPATLPPVLYLRVDDAQDRWSSLPGARRLEISAAALLLRPDGAPQNPDDDDRRALADLRATVTLWQDSRGPGLYQLAYHSPYRVDSRRAEAMARTFRAIDAYNRRDEARHGPPIDAAAFLLRLGAALRAAFLVDAPDRGPAGGTYDAADYRQLDAPAAAAYIRHAITQWRAAHPTPEPSAT
ncbi:MAG: hypothetical protein MUE92_00220 [Chloroflexi bacterium]|jgi:hypothetical protein|nr:hypothetical protein [Chloroflexota bacterium]